MKITIAGAGYVGLSLATLLSRFHEVVLIDIIEEKVNDINKLKSPIIDKEISQFFCAAKQKRMDLNLCSTTDPRRAYSDADIIVIATPTDYDAEKNSFNTKSVEEVVNLVRLYNANAWIVIKSTVPVGYTKDLNNKFDDGRIIFSPEFLREGRALYDNLHPSRIIAGVDMDNMEAKEFGRVLVDLLASASDERIDNVFKLICSSTEAEAIKLFANTYLAMRISYFNELDTYAAIKELNAEQIIAGVCADPRIGDFYNNPSFGYGGYCLPKDSKQLLANYCDVPQEIISAIVNSNTTRKNFIAQEVIKIAKQYPDPIVGVYKLAMKEGSDNYRQSSVLDVMKQISEEGITVQIFDHTLNSDYFNGHIVVKDLYVFKNTSTVIIANRLDSDLSDCSQKVYTRDLFRRD